MSSSSVAKKPVTDSPTRPRIQFSLLIVVLVSAICVLNWQLLLELPFEHFYPFAIVLTIAAWCAGQRYRQVSSITRQVRIRFSVPRVGLLIVILVCFFSLWLRHRRVASFHDDGWPRPFPYPDEVMMVFHDWLDSKFPAEPGYIKIHAEFYTVWKYLNSIALCLCAFVGVMLGLVCDPTSPVGIVYWRDRIVSMYRSVIIT